MRAVTTQIRAIDPGGRPLPADRELEHELVAACFSSIASLATAREFVRPIDLDSPNASRVYAVMCELEQQGRPIDAVTVAAVLREREQLHDLGADGRTGMAWLSYVEMQGRDARTEDVAAWAKQLRGIARKRRIVLAAQIVSGEGIAGTRPLVEFPSWATEQIVFAADEPTLSTMASTAEISVAADARITAQWNGEREPWGIRLPYEHLHRMLHGISPGEVIFISGLEGSGKSAMASEIAVDAAGRTYAGEIVGSAYLTLEMPKEDVYFRAICQRAGVSWRELQTGKDADGVPLDVDKVAAIDRARADLRALPILIDDADKDLSRVRDAARKADALLRQRGARLRVLVIDHVHIMEHGEGEASLATAIARTVRGLKRLAVELGVCIVALAQLTQDAARRDGPIRVADIRDAAAIRQIADKIVLIERPWLKLADKTTERARELKPRTYAVVGKHRNGTQGTMTFLFDGEHFRFIEVPEGFGEAT